MVLYMIFLLIFTVIALATAFVMLSSLVGFIRTGVPFVRTDFYSVQAAIREAGITASDVFYELGSGDGTVVFLVNRLAGARCVGFELTWWTHILSVIKLKVSARGGSAFGGKSEKVNISFRNEDFFNADWSEATVIYGYLYPPLMGRVEEKFLRDCRPGSRAVIRDFPFPKLKPKNVTRLKGSHELYVYEK